MSTQDKVKNAAEKGTGKIKEQLGKATDDKSLEPKPEHGEQVPAPLARLTTRPKSSLT